MKPNSLSIKSIALLLMAWAIGACSTTDEPQLQPFFPEQFGDLTVATIQSLETPYESVFAPLPGSRLAEGFADLAEIADKLSLIFPDADLLEIEVEEERGLVLWMFKIKMSTGGIVKIKFVQELGEIIKMKGVTGPFDYEIDPGGSFIAFSVAKALALEAVGGEIHSWSLELEENNEWEYEFNIVNGDRRFEVEITGFGTEVISIKEKQEEDDQDNDGDEEGEEEDEDGVDDEEQVDVPEVVLNFVTELFNGEVRHAERHATDNGNIWVVFLENGEGAVVKIKLLENDAIQLLGIEGEHGPFNYNVEPGMELLSLAAVLEDVFRETEGGELVQWSLRPYELDNGDIIWIYGFNVKRDNLRFEIEINALTGEFLEFFVAD